MTRLFADAAALTAGVVSLLVVSLGTNPSGVMLAGVLFVVSVLRLSRHAIPERRQS